MSSYHGRPGLSPVIAGLVAAGVISSRTRVLEVGVGDGTEAVALAELGIPVVGIDIDTWPEATDLVLSHELECSVRLLPSRADRLEKLFTPAQFDVVVDVLVHNNVVLSRDGARFMRKRARKYAEGVCHVLRSGGRWVVQARTANTYDEPSRDEVEKLLPQGVEDLFDRGPTVWSHIPEYAARGEACFAPIGVAVYTKR